MFFWQYLLSLNLCKKMKILFKSLVLSILLTSSFLFAQSISKATFLVKGDCSMCKERIETTAKKSGAKTASWNADSQKLEMEFDSTKVSADQILKNIADAGHDNEKYKADNSVYEKLPLCCHYERGLSFLKKTIL